MIKEEDTLNALRLILKSVGEDASREGLLETPQRILKSWATLYGGYKVDPDTILKTFEADGYNEIILLKNIEMYSMCEHHMLPFIGKAHVAYIPNKRVAGISKLARVVEMFSRRMQIQERLTEQVASFIVEKLEPKAAACIIEAQHLCMLMRGVNKQNSVMVTSSLKGEFLHNQKAREELMNLIKI
jgi:GTP cyclohydrolase IA